jgi:hypothetical protein
MSDRRHPRRLLAAAILSALCATCAAAGAASHSRLASAEASSRSTLRVTVGDGAAGAVIRPDFLGLSFETPALHQRAIVTQAPSLARLLQGLGGGLLRISGDSVDRTQWLPSPSAPAPWASATLSPADLASLAALTRASGWRVVLGLDLGHPFRAAAVGEARAATATLGAALAALEIGNEPDLYTRPPPEPFRSQLGASALRPRGWGLDAYEAESARLASALSEAGLRAPLWGPDTASGRWLGGYATDGLRRLSVLTAHLYPLDRCLRGRLTRGPSAYALLSRRVRAREALLIGRYVAVASGRGLPLRVDETNSVACGGEPGVSDSFASALWALDVGLTAAREGAAGLNFHGGLGACSAGGTILAPWYSPLCTLADGQLGARPAYYALLLLRALEGCRFVKALYRTSHNVSVYALRAPDGTLRIVVDDEDLPAGSRAGGGPGTPAGRTPAPRASGPVDVVVQADPSYRLGSVIRLSAPSVTAKSGVRLGGRALLPDGSFPATVPTPIAGEAGHFAVPVSAGSAALVVLDR